ncbi:MAG: hypothetical protein HYY06_22025 [Deltaproteobacteria bacterium]|nr:hypothetical protein [Deltaproteobacteria bacterium]
MLTRCAVVLSLMGLAEVAQAQDGAPARQNGDPLSSPALGPEGPALAAIVEGLGRDGIPSDLVLNKVREGLAKHVPPALITRAARALAARLRAAATLVTRGSAGDRRRVIRALAEALESGLTRGDLDRLLGGLAGASASALALAIDTATELRDRGFGSVAAVDAVRETYRLDGPDGFRSLLTEVATTGLASGSDRDERLVGVARGHDRDGESRGRAWGHSKAGGGSR